MKISFVGDVSFARTIEDRYLEINHRLFSNILFPILDENEYFCMNLESVVSDTNNISNKKETL